MTQRLEPSWLDQSLDSLWRRDSSGFGSGLSRATATRIGIDVVLVRVAFVVLAFCSGLGVALYAWGTALSPARPDGAHRSGPSDDARLVERRAARRRDRHHHRLRGAGRVAHVAAVGLALIAGALLLWWLARHRELLGSPEVADPSVPMDEESLVEDWRRRMSTAAGAHQVAPKLPVVDLFSPAPARARPAATEPVKSGWLAGLFITLGSIAAGLIPGLLLGVDPFVAIAIGSATLGLAVVVFAIVGRRRRLPRSFLGLLLVPLVACGWLSAGTAGALTPEVGTHSVRVIAQTTTVDLRDTDLSGIDKVEILAIASTVDVLLPVPRERRRRLADRQHRLDDR
ncbi:YibE/F family protein [Tessaracoccus sp. HDW20]|nr:YibE/F family protein [Tessaracoccus coleopterorum]